MSTLPSINDTVLLFLRERISARTSVPLAQVTEASVLVDLGLQSIDAVLVCGEVEDEFAIELDPASIFEHETLGSFASEILSHMDGK